MKFLPLIIVFSVFAVLLGISSYMQAVDNLKLETKKNLERESALAFTEEFKSGRFVPEPGFDDWGVGCCDPGETDAYLIFTYPVPEKLQNARGPSAYEIRYYRGKEPRRTVWIRSPIIPGARFGDGYGTKKTYKQFLKDGRP